MGQYICSRLYQTVLVLFGVSAVVFLLLHISGDPAVLLLPQDATQESIDQFRHTHGFDRPLYVQFYRFMSGAIRGDLGTSLKFNQPALGLVLERFPATLDLAIAALLISIVTGIPLGIISALKRNSPVDVSAMIISMLGQSIPAFWLGIMMILLFSVKWQIFPPFGRGGISHLILPAISLSTWSAARVARLTRSGMIEVLSQEYIRTARAKGLANMVVVQRHALKNAMLPIITVLELDLGGFLGGAVITETIFAWPGVGQLAMQSIYSRDYPVVQATVLVVAIGYVAINLLVDVAYAYLNPRIRFG
jgi:ABC-type dipeptide/oligopeptide/nickel transport system permease component